MTDAAALPDGAQSDLAEIVEGFLAAHAGPLPFDPAELADLRRREAAPFDPAAPADVSRALRRG
ncbi:hypothetical protein [Pseudoroseicyclus sp. CXY001]|uniref:hypothetical protein n=1 Tax=Pseudoroseicyclus sp. CXY001 TaxID=3242492 RepID=UPI0035711E1F